MWKIFKSIELLKIYELENWIKNYFCQKDECWFIAERNGKNSNKAGALTNKQNIDQTY